MERNGSAIDGYIQYQSGIQDEDDNDQIMQQKAIAGLSAPGDNAFSVLQCHVFDIHMKLSLVQK
jgi:hypothetical protein